MISKLELSLIILVMASSAGIAEAQCDQIREIEVGVLSHASVADFEEQDALNVVTPRAPICADVLLGYIERSTLSEEFANESVIARIRATSGSYYFNGWGQLLLPNGSVVVLAEQDSSEIFALLRSELLK